MFLKKNYNKALSYSIKAITVPIATLLFGVLIYITTKSWYGSLTAEEVTFAFPYILNTGIIVLIVIFTVLSFGATFGLISATTALRLSKGSSVEDNKKIRTYSFFGICISLVELVVLLFIML